MQVNRALTVVLACVVGVGAVGNGSIFAGAFARASSRHAAAGAGPDLPRPPQTAEQVFFDALNHHPGRRDEALDRLRAAARDRPRDGTPALWLGLCHLWYAAENDRADPATGEHAILAAHYLALARRLLPADGRIAGWLDAVRIRIAEREQDADTAAAARDDLRAALKTDPCFHAVALGIVSFNKARDSAEFKEGLAAMRRAAECRGDNPTVQDRARWPHNLEGFGLAMAQFELKAGNRQRAEVMLMAVQERESYAAWPHKRLAEDQLAGLKEALDRYANADPADDPPMVLAPGSGVSCRVCHQGSP